MENNQLPIIAATKDGFNRFADFSGVSTRSQYWYFVLSTTIATVIAQVAFGDFGITAGRIAVWWWGALGDDFDVTGGLLYSIPIDPKKIVKNRKKIISLVRKLEKEQKKNPLVTKYKGKWMGNYDMSRCRNVTDEIDQLILDEFGLQNYWPALLYVDQTLAKVTGERPGTLRKWPFPLE